MLSGNGLRRAVANCVLALATAAVWTAGHPAAADDPPPPPNGQAPEIIEDGMRYSDDWAVFWGKVVDDQPVEGLTVYISGLIEGTVTVDADDWYDAYFENIPPNVGFVEIWVVDNDGNASEKKYYFLA